MEQVAQKTYRLTIYVGHGHRIPPPSRPGVYLPDDLFIDAVAHFPCPPPPLESSLYILSRERPSSIDLQPFLFPGSFDLKFGVHLSEGEIDIIQGLSSKVKRDSNMERLGCYPVARFLECLREDLESPILEYRGAIKALHDNIIAECKSEKKRASNEDEGPALSESGSSGIGMWVCCFAI